jgi:hypothetical protein
VSRKIEKCFVRLKGIVVNIRVILLPYLFSCSFVRLRVMFQPLNEFLWNLMRSSSSEIWSLHVNVVQAGKSDTTRKSVRVYALVSKGSRQVLIEAKASRMNAGEKAKRTLCALCTFLASLKTRFEVIRQRIAGASCVTLTYMPPRPNQRHSTLFLTC